MKQLRILKAKHCVTAKRCLYQGEVVNYFIPSHYSGGNVKKTETGSHFSMSDLEILRKTIAFWKKI